MCLSLSTNNGNFFCVELKQAKNWRRKTVELECRGNAMNRDVYLSKVYAYAMRYFECIEMISLNNVMISIAFQSYFSFLPSITKENQRRRRRQQQQLLLQLLLVVRLILSDFIGKCAIYFHTSLIIRCDFTHQFNKKTNFSGFTFPFEIYAFVIVINLFIC